MSISSKCNHVDAKNTNPSYTNRQSSRSTCSSSSRRQSSTGLNCFCCKTGSFNSENSSSKEHFNREDSFIVEELKSFKEEIKSLVKNEIESLVKEKLAINNDDAFVRLESRLESIENTLTRNSKKHDESEQLKVNEAVQEQKVNDTDKETNKIAYLRNCLERLESVYKKISNKERCNLGHQAIDKDLTAAPPRWTSPLIKPYNMFDYNFNLTQFPSTRFFDDRTTTIKQENEENDLSLEEKTTKIMDVCHSVTKAISELDDEYNPAPPDVQIKDISLGLRNRLKIKDDASSSSFNSSSFSFSTPERSYNSFPTHKSPLMSLKSRITQSTIINEEDD